MDVRSRSFQIPEGKLGAFTLDQPVLDRIGGDQPMAIKPDQSQHRGGLFRQQEAEHRRRTHLSRLESVVAGDRRLSRLLRLVPLGVISVIGQQQGAKFQPYQTIAGDQLLMVEPRQLCRPPRCSRKPQDANTLITWVLRAVGLLLLAIGFALFMSPLGVIGDVIPFIGSIVRMGTGIVAFFLAIVVGTITIAIAWFYYRPLLAIGILVVGAVVASPSSVRTCAAAGTGTGTGPHTGFARSAGLNRLTARRRTPRSRLPRVSAAAGSRGASRRR